MNLKCIADANPNAMIKWFKDSTPISSENVLLLTENRTESNSTSTVSELRFEPVKRDDAGLYSCKAVNIIGESSPANYALDVQCSYNFVLFFFHNFFEKNNSSSTQNLFSLFYYFILFPFYYFVLFHFTILFYLIQICQIKLRTNDKRIMYPKV